MFLTAKRLKKEIGLLKRDQAVNELDQLRYRAKYQNDKSLIPHANKVYSQGDEDGIIEEIFNRIGTTNKIFVEFGVGDGLENNTLALLFAEWKGLWIEGSPKLANKIRSNFTKTIAEGHLTLTESFITAENIDKLISDQIPEKEIDLLSVDIDGNDFHIWRSIKSIKPRVLIVEYNAKFGASIPFCMDYNPKHVWSGDDCFGVSLKFLETALSKDGYSLVACNLTGVNSFFVRNDLLEDHFQTPYTAEQHFEPARYHLVGLPSGHPASYQALEQSYSMRKK